MKSRFPSRIALAAPLLTLLQACTAAGGPVSGVVVDEATGKPIADAIVVVRWHGNWTKLFGESSSACYHVESARTDSSGRFHIPAWVGQWSIADLRFTSAGSDFNVYKPGLTIAYKDGVRPSPSRIGMTTFTGTKEQYFDQVLSPINWACPQAGVSRRNLIPLYAATAQEAVAIAETRDQKGLAASLVTRAGDPLDAEGDATKR